MLSFPFIALGRNLRWRADDDLHREQLPLRDLAGCRKQEGESRDYYVTSTSWRDEVCRGLDSKAVATQLVERGLLLAPETGPHRAKLITVPGYDRLRLYHIPSSTLEGDRND
jgi:hypothetical protein